MPSPSDSHGDLAARLIAAGSSFARTGSQLSGNRRSLVSLRVLSNLFQDGGLRVGELAQREQIAQPSMTTAVNRLEADGLVTRRPDPEDARAADVQITDAGIAELMAFRARASETYRDAINELDQDDREALDRAAELMESLVRRLKTASADTSTATTGQE
ncbi:MarR family winged helix-turn-helix transcriptional regulator [Citricoccus sp. GCM10030269]|uniref:MarR family winged helix-turn-helix transcriptional regulator n=1 Tax=Citricoccus sp. GCM10030269 TaxID=3273388 RepID=UPI003619177C